MPYCMERGGIPQEGNKTGQLMFWEKEAFNYLHVFVAGSTSCDASVLPFMYNLQIICVGVLVLFFKKKKVSKASLQRSAAR